MQPQSLRMTLNWCCYEAQKRCDGARAPKVLIAPSVRSSDVCYVAGGPLSNQPATWFVRDSADMSRTKQLARATCAQKPAVA